MYRSGKSRAGPASSRGRNTGRENEMKLSGGEKFSFGVSEDGLEFHFCLPDKMKVDSDLLKNYKSKLKSFGGYSEDGEQKLWNDISSLRFLNMEYLPQEGSKEKVVQLDLNTAKDDAKPYSGTLLKKSDNFFSWILSSLPNLTEMLSYETKFVFLKNVFGKLLKMPYGFLMDLKFYAIYSNGIVYLLNHREDRSVTSDSQSTDWGIEFQQYLTYRENVTEGVVPNRDFRCVLMGKLGPHNLLFSASTDCFNPETSDLESPDPTTSVMLKCFFDNSRNRNNTFERFKMYDWCISLSSLNIPHVLVGFRTDDGIVQLLKLYTEDDLRQHGKGHWDINVGFTFAETALSFIEKTTKAKPGTVFSFKKSRCTNHIKAEEIDMENFPPKWFTEELKKSGVFEQASHH